MVEAHEDNGNQKELIARGIWPYDSQGRIVSGLDKLSDLEQRDFVNSEGEERFREPRVRTFYLNSGFNVRFVQGITSSGKRDRYLGFYNEVKGFDIKVEDISLETKADILLRYFPGQFGISGKTPIYDNNGQLIERRVNGSFKGVLKTAKRQLGEE